MIYYIDIKVLLLCKFDSALNLLDKIKEGKISLADAKNDQIEFKSSLGERKKGSKKIYKKSKKAHYTIEILYKARNNVINIFDDCSSMVSEAKHEATKGTRLKY